MSLHTWESDAPSVGSYKDQDFYENVLKPVGFDSVLFPLAAKRDIKNGESLTIASYDTIDIDGVSFDLQEDQPMGTSKLVVAAKKIVSVEKGRKLKLTRRTHNRTPFDILQAHKEQLQEMLKRDLERTGATALDSMPITYTPTSATAGSSTSNGTFGASQGSFVNVYHLQDLATLCVDDYRIPMHRALGAYAGIFRYETIVNIQQDDTYENFNQSMGLSPIADNRVVGKVANIAIMPTNDSLVVAKGIGTGSAYSGGYILGDEALIYAGVEQMSLHYDLTDTAATDHGRFKHLAILGDYAASIFSDSANAGLVRGIQIGSN